MPATYEKLFQPLPTRSPAAAHAAQRLEHELHNLAAAATGLHPGAVPLSRIFWIFEFYDSHCDIYAHFGIYGAGPLQLPTAQAIHLPRRFPDQHIREDHYSNPPLFDAHGRHQPHQPRP